MRITCCQRAVTGAFPQFYACRSFSFRPRTVPPLRCLAPLAEGTDAVSAAAPEAAAPLPTYAADIRVGKVSECSMHPDADSLYVERIDVGEGDHRTIISGLVKYVPLEEMQGRSVIVICNLKARNMRGIKSHGMVLCASNKEHTVVEPLAPPSDAKVGERVWFQEDQGDPETENRVQKKKLWDGIQAGLKTNDDLIATFEGVPMMTSAGPVTTASLRNASIS